MYLPHHGNTMHHVANPTNQPSLHRDPKTIFVFMARNNHDPSTSFPYRFLCNLLQKFMRAHNKYGVIMPRLVQTLRDCSPTVRSVDPYPGALSGALDIGSRARICKWVALGLKFMSSPIPKYGETTAGPKRTVLPYTLVGVCTSSWLAASTFQ